MASYVAGQSSGWHSHTGLHAVVVLSGTLTIVDGECRRHTYGPGDSYVGGQDVHLALNDSAAPLEMAVTYMFAAGVSHTGFHVPAAAPAGCEIR
jgi:quercetin dioxygenase-like cupin family protein